jgi:hypothetical protein
VTDEDSVNLGYPDIQSIQIKQDQNGLQPMGCRVPNVPAVQAVPNVNAEQRPPLNLIFVRSKPVNNFFAK